MKNITNMARILALATVIGGVVSCGSPSEKTAEEGDKGTVATAVMPDGPGAALWDSENLLEAVPQGQRPMLTCFTKADEKDSQQFSYADCSSEKHVYAAADSLHRLYEDKMDCISTGFIHSYTYTDVKGVPQVRYFLRYVPDADQLSERLLIYQNGVCVKAVMRSMPGKDQTLLKVKPLEPYQPLQSESEFML